MQQGSSSDLPTPTPDSSSTVTGPSTVDILSSVVDLSKEHIASVLNDATPEKETTSKTTAVQEHDKDTKDPSNVVRDEDLDFNESDSESEKDNEMPDMSKDDWDKAIQNRNVLLIKGTIERSMVVTDNKVCLLYTSDAADE